MQKFSPDKNRDSENLASSNPGYELIRRHAGVTGSRSDQRKAKAALRGWSREWKEESKHARELFAAKNGVR
jgi:hypothetical protein